MQEYKKLVFELFEERVNKTISYDMMGNIVNKNYSRNFKYRLDPSFKPLSQRTFLVQPYTIICYVMAIDNNDFKWGYIVLKKIIS